MDKYVIEIATINNLNEIVKLQIKNNNTILSYNSINNDLNNNELYLIIKNIETNNTVGYLATNNCYDHLDLISILIDENYRKKGLASSLLEYLTNYIKNNNNYLNIESIFLEVRKNNLSAIKLYEKNNYKYIGLRKEYYKNPNEDALIYMARVRNF